MKAIFFLLVIANSFSIWAQDKVRFGAVVGYSYVSVHQTGLTTEVIGHAKTGFMLGVSAEYRIDKNFSFVGNLNFESKGTEYRFEGFNDPSTGQMLENETQTLNYIVVSLLLKYRVGQGKLRPYFNLGLYNGLLLNNDSNSEYVEDFKRFDKGLSAGLGFELQVLKKHIIIIEARLNSGFDSASSIILFSKGRTIKTDSKTIMIGLIL